MPRPHDDGQEACATGGAVVEGIFDQLESVVDVETVEVQLGDGVSVGLETKDVECSCDVVDVVDRDVKMVMLTMMSVACVLTLSSSLGTPTDEIPSSSYRKTFPTLCQSSSLLLLTSADNLPAA